jgi:ubiquinone/menaquinone biosynthesis C-methylase UbiE
MRNPFRRQPRRVSPSTGYDQWAATYDTQPDNAVLALESALFTELLDRVSMRGKVVADIGCGTGRHWEEILSRQPARIIGVDSSARMIARLKSRYPDAEVYCAGGDRVVGLDKKSCDLVISTLALAHFADTAATFREWSRILRDGGAMLITDFHPDAIRAGMKRTFTGPRGTIEIEQHAIELDEMQAIALDCGLHVSFVGERAIGESVRHLFQGTEAIKKYHAHEGLRLVYGVHFTRP